MERPQCRTLRALVDLISPEFGARDGCLRILDDHEWLFRISYGSKRNHQAYKGGYYDHVCECMNYAVGLYPLDASFGRPMAHTLSDALLVLFLHDIEKPWRFEVKDGIVDDREEMRSEAAKRAKREEMVKRYEIYLTDEQRNGLEFVEGEGIEYDPTKRKMGPLAAFCHKCDIQSARVWHGYPLERDDPFCGIRHSARDIPV